MTFIPLHQQVIKHVCPSCDTPFMAHPFKKYCTTRCKKRADRMRVRDRENVAPSNVAGIPDVRFIGTVENPSLERLGILAETLKAVEAGKFYTLTGTIPVSDLTEVNGAFVMQQANGTWIIAKM